LIRDVIFAIQGIEGRYIKKHSPTFEELRYIFKVVSDLSVPLLASHTCELIENICELGNLFLAIKPFIDQLHPTSSSASTRPSFVPSVFTTALKLVVQSFCSAVQEEVNSYYKLVAVLETQATFTTSASSSSLTLKRIWVWAQEPLQRLRTLETLVSRCRGLSGGALLTVLYKSIERSGHPGFRSLASSILRRTCKPIFKMLR
jgi:gamma-tubulin complex component 3